MQLKHGLLQLELDKEYNKLRISKFYEKWENLNIRKLEFLIFGFFIQ